MCLELVEESDHMRALHVKSLLPQCHSCQPILLQCHSCQPILPQCHSCQPILPQCHSCQPILPQCHSCQPILPQCHSCQPILPQCHSCQPILGVNLSPEFVNLHFSYEGRGLLFFCWWQQHFEFQLACVAVEGRSNLVQNTHAYLKSYFQ